jgi:hypothetical protein
VALLAGSNNIIGTDRIGNASRSSHSPCLKYLHGTEWYMEVPDCNKNTSFWIVNSFSYDTIPPKRV